MCFNRVFSFDVMLSFRGYSVFGVFVYCWMSAGLDWWFSLEDKFIHLFYLEELDYVFYILKSIFTQFRHISRLLCCFFNWNEIALRFILARHRFFEYLHLMFEFHPWFVDCLHQEIFLSHQRFRTLFQILESQVQCFIFMLLLQILTIKHVEFIGHHLVIFGELLADWLVLGL